MERAQKWASEEFSGSQDVSPLITKVQSWVIVMIGGGEALGQVAGSYLYSRYDFRAQCDIFILTVILSMLWVLWLEK